MQKDKYGTRDLTYSAWHRAASIRRYVGSERAQLLSMCDTDSVLWLEFGPDNKHPLALIEVAVDVGQHHKAATAITQLARRSRVPAYLVLYDQADTTNPADLRWPDVRGFRVKRLWPQPDKTWRQVTPTQWATALLQIRAWSARRLDMEAANDDRYEVEPVQRQLFERGG